MAKRKVGSSNRTVLEPSHKVVWTYDLEYGLVFGKGLHAKPVTEVLQNSSVGEVIAGLVSLQNHLGVDSSTKEYIHDRGDKLLTEDRGDKLYSLRIGVTSCSLRIGGTS